MIRCRGRNGYFHFKVAVIWKIDKKYSIEIYSKKTGRSPPIEIYGERKELIKFFEEILRGLRSKTGIIKISEVPTK